MVLPIRLLSGDESDEEVCERAAALVLLVGAELQRREVRTARRGISRHYITRADLLPPLKSAWARLASMCNDKVYITTMGFDVQSFAIILSSGFEETWKTMPIDRNDVDLNGEPRLARRSLDAAGSLGLVLHFLHSCMNQTGLQQIFGLVPSAAQCYINFALRIMDEVLVKMPAAAIKWPTPDIMAEYSAIISERHPLLKGAFGSVDGLKLPVEVTNDPGLENANYNSWIHSHFVNQVFVFGPDAPLKSGQALPRNSLERYERLAFDRQLLSYHQTAEWGMRAIQGGFARLRVALPVEQGLRARLLQIVSRTYNLRVRLVGINQIKSVYCDIWVQADGGELWNDFGSMYFNEIRRNDRVACFHTIAVEV